MRAFGIPRNDDVANPDKADLMLYALKGARFHNTAKKVASRTLWKKIYRQELKKDLLIKLKDQND
jgi:hypothetical protein